MTLTTPKELPKNKVRICVTLDPHTALRLKQHCLANNYTISSYVDAVLTEDLAQESAPK